MSNIQINIARKENLSNRESLYEDAFKNALDASHFQLKQTLAALRKLKLPNGEPLKSLTRKTIRSNSPYKRCQERILLIRDAHKEIANYLYEHCSRREREALSELELGIDQSLSNLRCLLDRAQENKLRDSSRDLIDGEVSTNAYRDSPESTLRSIESISEKLCGSIRTFIERLPNPEPAPFPLGLIMETAHKLGKIHDEPTTTQKAFREGKKTTPILVPKDETVNIFPRANNECSYFARIETSDPNFDHYLAIYSTAAIVGSGGELADAGRLIRQNARAYNREDILELFRNDTDYPFIQDLPVRAEDETDITFPIEDTRINIPIPCEHEIIGLEFLSSRGKPISPYSLQRSPLGECIVDAPHGAIKLKVRCKKSPLTGAIPEKLYLFLCEILPTFPVKYEPHVSYLLETALEVTDLSEKAKDLLAAFATCNLSYTDNAKIADLLRKTGKNKLHLLSGMFAGTCFTLAYQVTNLLNLSRVPALIVGGHCTNRGGKKYVATATHCNVRFFTPDKSELIDPTLYTNSEKDFSPESIATAALNELKSSVKHLNNEDAVIAGSNLRTEILSHPSNHELRTTSPRLLLRDAPRAEEQQDGFKRLTRFRYLDSMFSRLTNETRERRTDDTTTIDAIKLLYHALQRDVVSSNTLEICKLLCHSFDLLKKEESNINLESSYIDILAKTLESVMLDMSFPENERRQLAGKIIDQVIDIHSVLSNFRSEQFLRPIKLWIQSDEARGFSADTIQVLDSKLRNIIFMSEEESGNLFYEGCLLYSIFLDNPISQQLQQVDVACLAMRRDQLARILRKITISDSSKREVTDLNRKLKEILGSESLQNNERDLNCLVLPTFDYFHVPPAL